LSGALHLVVFEQPELQVIFSNLVINEKNRFAQGQSVFFLGGKSLFSCPMRYANRLPNMADGKLRM
jgi:hypothetical protein